MVLYSRELEHMIPKIIHYCWFGNKPKSPLIEGCIQSWKSHCKDYTLIEWSEETFDVSSHPFTSQMYKEKKFAFVTDYVRLVALEKYGGIYLDTDMFLVQNIDTLLNTELLLGKESDAFISCGMIGAIPHHYFIKKCMGFYDNIKNFSLLRPNPTIITEIFNNEPVTGARILPPKAFYPYTSGDIKKYKGQTLSSDVYGVHLWNYSWGHPLNKFFIKIGVHKLGIQVTEKLRIKKLLKKILHF